MELELAAAKQKLQEFEIGGGRSSLEVAGGRSSLEVVGGRNTLENSFSKDEVMSGVGGDSSGQIEI